MTFPAVCLLALIVFLVLLVISLIAKIIKLAIAIVILGACLYVAYYFGYIPGL